MPERTIQTIKSYNYTHGKIKGRYYIAISYETWKTFDLDKMGTKVHCELNSLLNNKKKAIFVGSEGGYCKPYHWYGQKYGHNYNLILDTNLVRRVGIRVGLYADILLTHVYRFGGSVEQIFPKRLVHGTMEITPSGILKFETLGTSGILIENIFDDNFYANLVLEINRTYSFQLYTGTIMLLRKLIENLIIELLRTKFGMKQVDLFYSVDKGRHHDFSKLLGNLQNNLSSFKPYSPAFEKSMIVFLDKFREKSNSATHSIDIQPNWDYIESLKEGLNHHCNLFNSTIIKIRSEPKIT